MSRQAVNGAGDSAAAGDTALAFTLPGRDARGRIVRLDATLGAILGAHDYPPPLAALLAEALVLTVLIGTTLKVDEGQTTVQAQAEGGIVDLVVCDYRSGEVRGYLRFDADRAVGIADGLTLPQLFGSGYLAITIDQAGSGERYQGIVPLEGDTLTHAVESYFAQSEQIPTIVRAAIGGDRSGSRVAGGIVVQYLPHGETSGPRLDTRDRSNDWTHVALLAGTVTDAELVDPGLGVDELLWRLFNEDEIRVMPATPLARGCRCSVQHFEAVLSRFSSEELADMRGPDGAIPVNCEFCARIFPIAL